MTGIVEHYDDLIRYRSLGGIIKKHYVLFMSNSRNNCYENVEIAIKMLKVFQKAVNQIVSQMFSQP